MIDVLAYVLIYAIIFGAVYYGVTKVPLPVAVEPFREIVKIAVLVVFVIFLIVLVSGVPFPTWPAR